MWVSHVAKRRQGVDVEAGSIDNTWVLDPPIVIGGCWAGRGWLDAPSTSMNRPWKVASSCVHTALTTPMSRPALQPLGGIGEHVAGGGVLGDVPAAPMPSTMRPQLIWSIVVVALVRIARVRNDVAMTDGRGAPAWWRRSRSAGTGTRAAALGATVLRGEVVVQRDGPERLRLAPTAAALADG